MIDLLDKLLAESRRLLVPIEPDQAKKLLNYTRLLDKWSARINLTGAANEAEIGNHIIDCLALVPHIPTAATTLVDVGAGGGLPSIVLAIVQPRIAVMAVEPIKKKWAFLRTASRELPLTNFRAVSTRVEDLTSGHSFVPFDVAVSRATFPLPEWLEIGRTLVTPRGVVLGMEGSEQHVLPTGATRHPYRMTDRQRAIIRWGP